MGKADPIINGFTAGEMSELMDGRTDFNKYRQGCSTLENMIPLPQGPAQKRPGWKYIATAHTETHSGDDTQSRLIPFVFNADQAYVLEFHDYSVRFFYNGAQLMNGAVPYEIVSPYAVGDLEDIDYVQSADVMYLVHGNYVPRKLKRTDPTDHLSFEFEQITWKRGPQLAIDQTENMKLETYTYPGHSEVTHRLVASDNYAFKPGDEYTCWKITWNEGVSQDSVEGTIYTDDFMEDSGSFTATGQESTLGFIPNVGGYYSIVTLSGTWEGTFRLYCAVMGIGGVVMSKVLQTHTQNTPATGTIVKHEASNTSLDFVGAVMANISSGTCEWDYRLCRSVPFKSITVPSGYTYKVELWRDDADYTDVRGQVILERSWDGGQNWDIQTTWSSEESDYPVDEDYENNFQQQIIVRLASYNMVDDTLKYKISIYKEEWNTRYFFGKYYHGAQFISGWIQPNDDGDEDDIPSTASTNRIYPSAWSSVGDIALYDSVMCGKYYPTKVCLFEDRLVFASTSDDPHKIWMSKSGDWESFEIGPDDDDAIELSIASDVVNSIEWLHGGNVLLVGTAGGIYRIGAANPDEALTPSNVSARLHVRYGSAPIKPVRVGHGLLFVNRSERRVYECKQEKDIEGYVAKDLTLLAEHISSGGIKRVVYQESPHSILWVLRDDGVLCGLTYLPEHDIYAWHRHPTYGYIDDICSIPGDGQDELWAATRRLNYKQAGDTTRYWYLIEKLDPFPEPGDTDLTDRVLLDQATVYSGSPIDEIDCGIYRYGTVAIIADGVYRGDYDLSDKQTYPYGVVSLGASYSDIIVGWKYTAKLRTMRLDLGDLANTTQGRNKDILDVVVRLYQSIGGYIGSGSGSVDGIPTGSSLYTGDILIPSMRGGHGTDGYVYLEHTTPQPFTVSAIMPKVQMDQT